jgi:hypothetical protein
MNPKSNPQRRALSGLGSVLTVALVLAVMPMDSETMATAAAIGNEANASSKTQTANKPHVAATSLPPPPAKPDRTSLNEPAFSVLFSINRPGLDDGALRRASDYTWLNGEFALSNEGQVAQLRYNKMVNKPHCGLFSLAARHQLQLARPHGLP